MTKKHLSKLLSVILALAICSATVFGCLITANAADNDFCTLSNGVISADLQTLTVDVEFQKPSTFEKGYGIFAGEFTLADNQKLTLKEITYVSGELLDGTTDVGFKIDDSKTNNTNTHFFEVNNSECSYNNVKFRLTYSFVGGSADKNDKNGYEVKISGYTLSSSLGISNEEHSVISSNAVATTVKLGCDHVISVDGKTPDTTTDNYYVYSNIVCSNCGETLGTQLVPKGEVKSTVWWNAYDLNGDFITNAEEGVGDSEDNPYIIESSLQLRYLAQRFTTQYSGKYFKIADGVDIICLQSATNLKKYFTTATTDADALNSFMSLSSNSEVKAYFDAVKGSNDTVDKWQSTPGSGCIPFDAHIDFNGATIVGMYNENGGLFSQVGPNASFKNLKITNSYVSTADVAGAIFGGLYEYSINLGKDYYSWVDGVKTLKDNAGEIVKTGTVKIDNAEIVNTYVETSSKNLRGGVVFGYASGEETLAVSINNLFVSDCKSVINGTTYNSLYGQENGNINLPKEKEYGVDWQFENMILIGTTPFNADPANQSKQIANPENYNNVYTTNFGPDPYGVDKYSWKYTGIITVVDSANVFKGTNAKTTCPGLDWTTWSYDAEGGYPTLLSKGVDSVSMSDLNVYAANAVYNADGSFGFKFYIKKTKSGIVPNLYVGDANGKKFETVIAEIITAADATTDLPEGTLCYTINNIPARQLGDELIVTAVAQNAGKTVWGKSLTYSGEQYLNDVVNEVAQNVTSADKQVAVSLMNYADASNQALSETEKPGTTVMWNDYEPDGKFITEAGDGVGDSEANPYIITSAGQLRYLAQNFSADYAGKYFKVVDGVDVICLQSSNNLKANFGVSTDAEALNKLMSLSSYYEVKTYFETYTEKRNKWQSGVNSGFCPFDAHIDFNGATVIGMYNENGGLFPKVGPNASFKNLKIANSYVKTGDGAGALFGAVYDYSENYGTDYTIKDSSGNTVNKENTGTIYDAGTVKVENLEIANTYVETTTTNNRAGVLFGYTRWTNYLSLSMNNVLIYGSTSVIGETVKNSLFGQSGTNLRPEDENEVYNWQFENSILIGIKPFQASHLTECQQIARYANFNNVYTTNFEDTYYMSQNWETKAQYANRITEIDANSILGITAKETCSALDWANTWVAGATADDYPTLANPNAETVKETIYYSGDKARATEFSDKIHDGSTEENAIIISTAEELAYLANGVGTASQGKFYKMADNIGTIVLQSQDKATDILSLASSAEVKTYFENTDKSFYQWGGSSDWNTNCFCGTFDGNGVEIYGLYGKSTSNSEIYHALFGNVDSGATFKNISLKNSYMNGRTRVGGIAAFSAAEGYVLKDDRGFITVDNCTVANCYMYSSSTTAFDCGVMLGNMNDHAKFNNCLVYGNDVSNESGRQISLYGTVKANNVDDYTNTVTNSIILDTTPYCITNFDWGQTNPNCFSNVYTDSPSGLIQWSSSANHKQTYTDAQIKHIELSDVKGTNAQAIVDKLNEANGSSTVWYTSNYGDYPTFKENAMPAAYQSAYEQVTFDTVNDYGEERDIDFGVYRNSLSLYNNPYMSITFMFGKECRENLGEISITINDKEIDKVPTDEGVYFAGKNNWTHNEGAGRYYLYSLKNAGIDVKDLCEPIVIKMTYGEKTVTSTVSVAGLGNEFEAAYRTYPSTYYSARVDAVKALMFYVQSVKARYGA